ncbi:hypothetical protein N8I77_011663 [Diaporthe amygdali]|uniref:Uncharacterized protein n=1 Tax=Phomopsis amygdali TaxID=1214568 RepID=A0AAD9S3D4_PHOAM|nr:hypothetical protein N8I77_011663 [Diaporthe amygdali]
MSTKRRLAGHERGRSTSRSTRPHFRLVPPNNHSPHEQAVIKAGYPWVRTNCLVPTWLSPDSDPRPKSIPDRLNPHGHHGINTHLIVEGDLTLIPVKKFFGKDHVAAKTMSTDPGSQKELSVAPYEIYWGMTQQACKFVEGHRNLSPRSVHRYMSRGGLEWIDKTGRAVKGTERTFILQQLDGADFKTHFDFKAMRRLATCSFKEDNQVTRSMRQWFLQEWNDPDVQAARGDLRPAIHPLESPPPSQAQDHDMDDIDDEVGFLGDDMDPDDEDGSAILTEAFQDWLKGGLPHS